MKRLVIILFIFGAAGIGAVSVSAQSPTRIYFRRGASSAVVTGALNGYKSQRVYVIHVRKGLRLTTEDAGKDHPVTIGVRAPLGSNYEQDMAADCHDRNDVNPTVTGDYRITVTECQKADPWKGTFRFRVTVR